MNTEYTNEFQYGGFSVSRQNIESYLNDMDIDRKSISWANPGDLSFSAGIVQSMIFCIANNDAKFDVRNTELCHALEEMIIRGGYDRDGVYSPVAHAAMRNLRAIQGKNPDDYVLQNKTSAGTVDKVKSKLKSLFGFGKKKQTPTEPAISPVSTSIVTPLDQQPKQEQKTTATPQNKKTILYKIAAAFTGVVAIGASLIMTSNTTKTPGSPANDNSKAPTFKTITLPSNAHHMAQAYNMSDNTQIKTLVVPVQNKSASNTNTLYTMRNALKSAPDTAIHATKSTAGAPTYAGVAKTYSGPIKIAKKSPVIPKKTISNAATDSLSAQLTRTSKSSLNILLGAQKADSLCRRIQSQIDAGIFAAPNGMSIERIAHAMTMSRIYEGKSIILTALQSTTKLTPAQQAEFNQHIDEIGDMGVKLQKRMAAKHKLSNHSKFNQATQSAKKLHIQNLKQLKQMRKMAHTR